MPVAEAIKIEANSEVEFLPLLGVAAQMAGPLLDAATGGGGDA